MNWWSFVAGMAFAFVTMVIGFVAAALRWVMQEFDDLLK